jgi:hypothetical protein
MQNIYSHPFLIFAVALVLQWFGAFLGHTLRKWAKPAVEAEHGDLGTILGATLTLLALIIGFTFSMAVSRYDERKRLEAAEANAIRTGYLRADLLPAGVAPSVRKLLVAYVEQRILYYDVTDEVRLRRIQSETARLQADLWSAVAGPATAPSTPASALAVSGINDVLNSEGLTRAAWLNRIPVTAWALMLLVAFAGNMLLGSAEKRKGVAILVVLPIIVSVPCFLIADIDSPRMGIINVVPENLVPLAQSLKPQP